MESHRRARCEDPRQVAPPRRGRLAVGLTLAMLAATGCLPLPDVRPPTPPLVESYRVDPATVAARRAEVPGTDVPGTPDRYDVQTTLRWALDEPAETIVVAMPGLFGGATNFAPLARRLVAAAPGTQVWAIDRRANALEDREAALDAVARGDPELVVDAYIGREGEAPTFRVPDPDAFRFVADWGLDVHLGDLDAVVSEARATAPRVVLMGHSMGASLAALYAAWRTPDGPGYEKLDGLVLVDGAPGRTGAYGFARGFRLLGLPIVLPTVEALDAGETAPWVTLGRGGAVFAERLGTALLASLAPEDDAPTGALRFPASNLAYAGIVHDDQYGAFRVFSASLGVVTGAELNGNLPGYLLGGSWAARSGSVVGVARGADRVEWDAGDPRLERTSMGEYLAGWTDRRADGSEWYMPLRLLQDLTVLPPDLVDVPGFVPMSEVPTPALAVGSDRGLLRDADAFAGYAEQRLGAPVTITILAGLTHQDVLTARDNPLVPLLARWASLLP